MSRKTKSTKTIPNNNCWIFDYEPNFKNLVFPKQIIHKFKNLISNKTIYMNLMIIGCNGCGKQTYLKCILYDLYNIKLNMFKQHNEFLNIFIYKSIYIINFKNIYNNQIIKYIDFINIVSRRTLLFDDSIDKIIILKNINNISNENIKKLKNIIEKQSLKTKFIILTNNPITLLNSYMCCVRIPILNNVELKKSIQKILKYNNIDLKNYKITYKYIYNTYKNINYNFKDLILWLQYMISNNKKNEVIIKHKLIGSLLSYVLTDYKLNIKSDELHINKIKSLIYNLIGLGITYLELITISMNMVLKEKQIKHDFKQNIIELASKANIQLTKVDKKIFVVQDYFINITIFFKLSFKKT